MIWSCFMFISSVRLISAKACNLSAFHIPKLTSRIYFQLTWLYLYGCGLGQTAMCHDIFQCQRCFTSLQGFDWICIYSDHTSKQFSAKQYNSSAEAEDTWEDPQMSRSTLHVFRSIGWHFLRWHVIWWSGYVWIRPWCWNHQLGSWI